MSGIQNWHTWIRTASMCICFCAMLSSCTPLEKRNLSVIVNRNSPPLSYRDANGHLVGFHVDLAETICKSIDVTCDIHEEPIGSSAIESISSGSSDIAIVGLIITPERSRQVLFTSPYRSGRSFWISRHSMSESRSSKVAVKSNSLQQTWAHRASSEYGWTVVSVPVPTDLETALHTGQVDAAIAPPSYGFDIIRKGQLRQDGFKFEIIDDKELNGPVGVAITPSKSALRDRINRVLQELIASGQLNTIESRHFQLTTY